MNEYFTDGYDFFTGTWNFLQNFKKSVSSGDILKSLEWVVRVRVSRSQTKRTCWIFSRGTNQEDTIMPRFQTKNSNLANFQSALR